MQHEEILNKVYGIFDISFDTSSSKEEELNKQLVFEALYEDNLYPFSLRAEAVESDKGTAKITARCLRERNSPKRSASRLVQCGLWSHSIIIHEAYKDESGYHWKLSKKELESARKTELYQRLKAEYEAENVGLK